jgi:hypothetical protein
LRTGSLPSNPALNGAAAALRADLENVELDVLARRADA